MQRLRAQLQEAEQKALITSTMRRYNKTLIPELEEKILKHKPARSPLFLRVVLDELRVCGRQMTEMLDDGSLAALQVGEAAPDFTKAALDIPEICPDGS